MPAKHTLSTEAGEFIRERMAEVTEEVKTKFDPDFRQPILILHLVGEDGLPDGLTVLFPKGTHLKWQIAFLEAAYNTVLEAGLKQGVEYLPDAPKDSELNWILPRNRLLKSNSR